VTTLDNHARSLVNPNLYRNGKSWSHIIPHTICRPSTELGSAIDQKIVSIDVHITPLVGRKIPVRIMVICGSGLLMLRFQCQ
jgi:hypothetical protein